MKHRIKIPEKTEVLTVSQIPIGIEVFAVPVIPELKEFDPTNEAAWEAVFKYMVETTTAAIRKLHANKGENDLWGPFKKVTTEVYSPIPRSCVKFMSNAEFIFMPMSHEDWLGCIIERSKLTASEIISNSTLWI